MAAKAGSQPHQHHHPAPKGRDDFVQHLSSTAEAVAKESGIPASFMLGQAGHETGWGRSEIRNKDGSTSFNLFGIKAGKGWTGKVAEVTTTEYINGVPRKVVAKFRAYDSYEDSFRDYARLITDNPATKSPGHGPDWLCRGLCRRTAEGWLRHRPRIRQETQRRHPERTAGPEGASMMEAV